MLRVGIVGLPNVGKSTVFNALSQAGARVSNFPFCTVEPNVGVVAVPDGRLERLREVFGQAQAVPATIQFVDVAGLVRGAHRGEGLGNQFLGHLREADAILHVVRCFPDDQIVHVEGGLDPVRDAELVELELILADLAQVERALEGARTRARTRDSEALRLAAALEGVKAHLEAGESVRTLSLGPQERELLHGFGLLTAKPALLLANVGERDGDSSRGAAQLAASARRHGLRTLDLCAKLEADLGELDPEERQAFAAELDLGESGLLRVIRACYELLGLVTFFTGVGREVRAWAVPAGTTARQAAGRIHSDMERGFIRAEVISYPRLVEPGVWEEAQRRGEVRSEGQHYGIQEGDVVRFRFSA